MESTRLEVFEKILDRCKDDIKQLQDNHKELEKRINADGLEICSILGELKNISRSNEELKKTMDYNNEDIKKIIDRLSKDIQDLALKPVKRLEYIMGSIIATGIIGVLSFMASKILIR